MHPAEFGNLATNTTLWKSQKRLGGERNIRRRLSEGSGRLHNGWDASCYDGSLRSSNQHQPLRHQAAASPLLRSTPSLRAYARWLRYLYSLFPSASGYLTDGLRATRKPLTLERPAGPPGQRYAARQFAAPLTQPPPRNTRYAPSLGP